MSFRGQPFIKDIQLKFDAPDPNVGPVWEIPKNTLYHLGIYGRKNHRESQENTINTMGTLLGVHPIIP